MMMGLDRMLSRSSVYFDLRSYPSVVHQMCSARADMSVVLTVTCDMCRVSMMKSNKSKIKRNHQQRTPSCWSVLTFIIITTIITFMIAKSIKDVMFLSWSIKNVSLGLSVSKIREPMPKRPIAKTAQMKVENGSLKPKQPTQTKTAPMEERT